MPFRAWVLAVALGLIACLGQAQDLGEIRPGQTLGQPEAESIVGSNDSERDASQEDQTANQTADYTPAADAEISAVPADEESRENENDADDEAGDLQRRDIAAQESMAESTWKMVAISWIAVVLTGVGVLLIWRTMGYTREAAEAAKKTVAFARISTDAAVRAADAAVAAVNSDRAWLIQHGFEAGRPENFRIGDAPHARGFIIAIKWKNFGQTPAFRVGFSFDKALISPDSDTPIFEMEQPPSQNGIIAPTQVFQTQFFGITNEDFELLLAREIRLIIYSRAIYSTARDDHTRHTSESCVEVSINGERVQPDGKVVPNVLLGPVGKQNTAC